MNKTIYFIVKQYVYFAILALFLIQFFFPAGGLETDELIMQYWIFYVGVLISLFIVIAILYLKVNVVVVYLLENRICKIIDILCFNFVIVLFLSEITIFTFSSFSSDPLFAMNPWVSSWINHVRPQPYTDLPPGRVNGGGYLDTEFSEIKNNNTYRIIALGDSFSFGDAYKYVHYTLLESLLNKNSNSTVYEVYNMGVGATDPNHYYQIYKESLKYKPDLVIVTLYVGNDFTMELFGKSSNIFKRSNWYTYTFFRRLYSIYSGFEKKQQITNNIYYVNSKNKTPALLPQDGSDFPSQNEILQITKKNMKNKKLGDVNLSDALSLYDNAAYREVQKVWEKNIIQTHFYEIMGVIKKMNEEMNGRFMLFIAPDIIQIDDGLRDLFYLRLDNELAYLRENKNDYDFTMINEKIMKYCTQNNIICTDILPELRKGRRSYYVNVNGLDLHWNEWGNYIAAKEEYSAISSRFNKKQ